MSSKPVCHVTKKTTGHGPYKPRATKGPGDGGSNNVFVNNLGANIVTSKWNPHTPPPNNSHAREDNQQTVSGSATVFVNGQPLARIGDSVDGADIIAGGSNNVFAGDSGNVDVPSISFTALTNGDDYDADEPGTAKAYIANQVTAGNLHQSQLDQAQTVVSEKNDTTPAPPKTTLSSDCSDIASLTPFPSGSAIDNIVLTNNFNIGNLTRSPSTTFDNPLRGSVGDLSLEEICCNLKLLAVNCLDPIKAQYRDLLITNTWRSPGTNAKSQHPKGQAADMQFKSAKKADYYQIAQWIKDNVQFDQLLLEYKTTGTGLPWIHISFNKSHNRNQVLTLMNNVTYAQGLSQLG